MKKITHLGIDIGGAHLKIIGVDENERVRFVDYSSCRIWEDIDKLKIKFLQLNKTFSGKPIKCAITMSAELCDNFKNRKHGVSILIEKCNYLNFDKFFYVASSEIFSKKPKLDELISMNWHSIGRFIQQKIQNAIIVDFGSTTTDLICIKEGKVLNKFLDDFSRINNYELLYTGFTRTPIFGVTNEIEIHKKKLKIIPEFFSDTSDIYRVLQKLKKQIDIDKTADHSNKTIRNSLKRISRSFGFDYKIKFKGKLEAISNQISLIQLNYVLDAINKLKLRFDLEDFTIITSGTGQDVITSFLKKKKYKTKFFYSFLKNSCLNKQASLHAPALSVALLLKQLK